MFGIGLPELIIIMIVALVVVGPERLPEMGRKLGKTVNDLRRMYTGLREQLGPDFDEVEKQVRALRSLDPRRELNTIGQRALDGLTKEVGDVPELLRFPTSQSPQGPTTTSELLEAGRTGQAPQYPYLSSTGANGTNGVSQTIAPPVQPVVGIPVATQQTVGKLSQDLLNDDLLDQPIADTTADRTTT